MIPFSDPDCNKVEPGHSPDVTYRCTLPEGHTGRCGLGGRWEVMFPNHRRHVPTNEKAFPAAVGRRRRTIGDSVADGAHRLDAALRFQRDLALAVAGVQ